MMTVVGRVEMMECGVSPVNQTTVLLVSALANDQFYLLYLSNYRGIRSVLCICVCVTFALTLVASQTYRLIAVVI